MIFICALVATIGIMLCFCGLIWGIALHSSADYGPAALAYIVALLGGAAAWIALHAGYL